MSTTHHEHPELDLRGALSTPDGHRAPDLASGEHLAVGGIVPGSRISQRVRELLAGIAAEASAHAARQRELYRFHLDPAGRDPQQAASAQAAADAACAVALRCDAAGARRLIRDAVLAVEAFPLTLERLASADLPAPWFTRILRASRDLPDEDLAILDETISDWPLHTLTFPGFRRRLRRLVMHVAERSRTTRSPADQRTITWQEPNLVDGTSTLEITGPTAEITDLVERLNAAARAVQDAQRLALRDGLDEIPFDLDGEVQRTAMVMSLGQIRYAVMTRSILDTGGVPVPNTRRRVNITVPALTALGASNEPGLLEGETPVPGPVARAIAGAAEDWWLVLTDPATGAFLGEPAIRYRPGAAVLELTHLKTPLCAHPGCTRPSRGRIEVDHIEEFNHEDPLNGGKTVPENLHHLCLLHHRIKTEGFTDPHRIPGGATRWSIGDDVVVDILDNQDLGAPENIPEFRSAFLGKRRSGPPTARSRLVAAREDAPPF